VPRTVRVLIPIFPASAIAALLFLLSYAPAQRLPVFPALSARSAPETPDHASDILLSRQLMEQARLHVGDIVTLAADQDGTGATQFRVAGVYEPTPDPMKFTAKRLEARLHLPDLIALTDPQSPESVSALNVALVNPQDADAFTSTVIARTPGLRVQRTVRPADSRDPFAVLERFHWAIAIVTVIGSTAFLLALMVMRAEERRDVIGILRLIGIPGRSILIEVLLEGLLIALAGAVFGLVVARAGEGVVNRFFQWRYDTTLIFVRVTLPIAWRSVAFAVPLGVIAGLVASWTLLRRDVGSLVRR
jgi:ABC-type lipoprotein release transport system permease subunit